ncbi:hypothetical protein ACOME3_005708 [Neoechinorhynchus agilis]
MVDNNTAAAASINNSSSGQNHQIFSSPKSTAAAAAVNDKQKFCRSQSSSSSSDCSSSRQNNRCYMLMSEANVGRSSFNRQNQYVEENGRVEAFGRNDNQMTDEIFFDADHKQELSSECKGIDGLDECKKFQQSPQDSLSRILRGSYDHHHPMQQHHHFEFNQQSPFDLPSQPQSHHQHHHHQRYMIIPLTSQSNTHQQQQERYIPDLLNHHHHTMQQQQRTHQSIFSHQATFSNLTPDSSGGSSDPNSMELFSGRKSMFGPRKSVKSEPDQMFPTHELSEVEKSKIERKRERNRIAARKCRTRKLERIAELEKRVAELSLENEQLSANAVALKNYVQELHRLVLEHRRSGCVLIRGNQVAINWDPEDEHCANGHPPGCHIHNNHRESIHMMSGNVRGGDGLVINEMQIDGDQGHGGKMGIGQDNVGSITT